MAIIRNSFRGWPAGVITSGRPERNPRTSAAHGYNTILTNVNATGATPTTRPGMLPWITTKTHTGAITSITDYVMYEDDGSHTSRMIVTGDDGGVWSLGFGLSPSSIVSGVFTADAPPSVALAKNLCFIVDDVAQRKLWGINCWKFGIERPSTAPSIGPGLVGVMTGTYEVRVTFGNSNTGHESSAGPTSNAATATLNQLGFADIPVSTDPQVDQRHIYIRNTDSQTIFRRAGTIENNTATVYALNVDTSTLVVSGPNTLENDPPPSTAKHIAWHNSYMFVADEGNLYWSKQNQPEAFDSSFEGEPVGAGDGQSITALYSFQDILLIFKTRSVYALQGSTPSTWRLSQLFSDIGCIGEKSIITANGAVWFWATGSINGPAQWDGSGAPTPIGPLLLDFRQLPQQRGICAGLDYTNSLVLWSIPYDSGDDTHNSRIIAIHYERGIVASDKWDGMDISAIANVTTTSDGLRQDLFFGNYNGTVFIQQEAVADGFPLSGTLSGTFIPVGTSISSITGTGFYTAGNTNLAEVYVTILDADGAWVARKRISSSTSTVLTLASSVTDLTPGSTYTYLIGVPNFEWHTVEEDGDQPFLQKRLLKGFISMTMDSVEGDTHTARIDTYVDGNTSTVKRSNSAIATLDEEEQTVNRAFSVGAVCHSHSHVVSQRESGVRFTLLGLEVTSEVLTEKLG